MVFPRCFGGFGLVFLMVGCVNFGDPIVGGRDRDAAPADGLDAPSDDLGRACLPACGADPWRRVCDPATGGCVGCLRDDDCVSGEALDGGSLSASRRCDTARHTCVACLGDADCPAGLACADGQCAAGCVDGAPCANGETCCGSRCVDPRRSLSDCGRCGARCEVPYATALCREGLCAVGSCDVDRADCDGLATNGCETNLRAVNNCGACGVSCPAAPFAEARCEGPTGRCALTCMPGHADCNGRADDGCEVDTNTDVSRCGGCATSCQPAHATGRCVAGACGVERCDPGTADCDGGAANGCEVLTASDPRNCGACGRACGATEVCAAGACQSTCAAPRRTCAGECVDVASDPRHCGACGAACAAGLSCVAGACTVVCHNQGETACGARCVLLSSDPTQCGRCGAACATGPGGRAVCASGACGIACDAGRADCDANAATGCEVDLATSAAHCGRCGATCAPAHATPSCVSGRCGVAACAAGFGDCDANQGNGCELDLRADDRNCGACGRSCGVATTCVAGACVMRPGSLDVAGAATLDGARAAARASAGSTTVTLSDRVGSFAVGMRVLLHQTRAPSGAGRYEYARVTAVGADALTLEARTVNAYVTDAQSRAQVVQVRELTDVLVRAGATLTAPAWDGRTGGIMALDASGDASVAGTVTMDGRGYRGTVRDCATSGRYRCAPGAQGESPTGAGSASSSRNGAGGGGGGQGSNCGAGGGGAYGAAGGGGSVGECTFPLLSACAPRCPNPGGQGGAASNTSPMTSEVLFGGAGGEGGADDDGATPGGGGNGGGVILWRVAGRLEVLGEVRADGAAGREGVQSSCGGNGCGMGGGGGGAGGAVRLTASVASLGVERVHARGGAGANCTCARLGHADRFGGAGGAGRIGVVAPMLTGVTNPAAER